ncbi:MAG: FecR domain-containing protein, partial [Rhodospirillales bacterium]|nr:FecR domain-containing protein [Rhodospirillales bacterium]
MATITATETKVPGLPEGTTPAHVIEATGSETLTLPAGVPLADCDFARAGDNLVLTAPDGTVTVVRGYFGLETPPALVSAGGGELAGDLVTQLAGPLAPGQYAQAGAAPGAQPIGTVETLHGRVTAIRADGTRVELQAGDPVYQGDILETGADGAIGVVLADESTFSMAADGRMVLDEMVYDPSTQSGSINFSVVQGIFTFVSGQIAKTDPDAMTLTTPVATIGIRGTQVGIEISDGQNLRVVLMEESDGFVGEVVVRNDAGVEVMNGAHDFTVITGFNVAPSPTATMSVGDVVQMFSSSLSMIPTTGTANPYSVPQDAPDELRDFGVQGDDVVGGGFETDQIRVTEGFAASSVEGDHGGDGNGDGNGDGEGQGQGQGQGQGNRGADPTPPTVTISAASGPEDSAIALTITAGVPGGSVTGITITVVPVDATLSAGTKNGDGSWTLTPGQLAGLMITPPQDFTGQLELSVTATGTSPGGIASASATAAVTVTPASVADSTISAGADLTVAEDGTVALSITPTLAGGETLDFVTISGVPTGALLSAGTNNGDGTWTLTSAQLAGLTLTPAADSNEDITLTVQATLTDGSVTTSDSVAVTVTPVADSTISAGPDLTVAEDGTVALSITPTLAGGETLDFVTISGVPTGATLSAGTNNGDGTWTLSAADLADLTLTPAADSNEDITLTVQATLTDGSVTTSDSVAITVTPVADSTISAGPDLTVAEDGTVAVAITPTLAGGETLDFVTISGVPTGATLSAGTNNGDGTWTLSAADLTDLTLTPPADFNGSLELTVQATLTDGSVTPADSVAITVTPVADSTISAG